MAEFFMLGMGSGEMALAYWLTILSAVFCVVWGALNWNRGLDGEGPEERGRRRRARPRRGGEERP
ncbi:MAG: symporter small accessory protein [Thermodesulfobacteriota bacterium]